MTKRRLFGAAALLAAALLVLGACGGDDLTYPTETRPLTPGGEVIPPRSSVTLRLPESARARFAGYYAAEARGFYKERKLDVAIRPGNPERAVASGEAEFGIGVLRDLLAARDRGSDLVNVAQVFKRGKDGIFVSGSWIARPANRDVAVRFLEGSFEGWVFCRDKPRACLRIVRDREPTVDATQLNEVNARIWPTEHGIGLIDAALVRRSPAAYRDDLAVLALTELGHHGLDLTGAGWEPK